MFTVLVCETGIQDNTERILEDRKIIIPVTLILGGLPDSSQLCCHQDILVPWLPSSHAPPTFFLPEVQNTMPFGIEVGR